MTVGTGRYVLTGAHRIDLEGRCWKGYESFPCTRAYHLDVSGDHLTLSAEDGSGGQVAYRRIGVVGRELPPTLAPPAMTGTAPFYGCDRIGAISGGS